jgi:hypothetical protein
MDDAAVSSLVAELRAQVRGVTVQLITYKYVGTKHCIKLRVVSLAAGECKAPDFIDLHDAFISAPVCINPDPYVCLQLYTAQASDVAIKILFECHNTEMTFHNAREIYSGSATATAAALFSAGGATAVATAASASGS